MPYGEHPRTASPAGRGSRHSEVLANPRAPGDFRTRVLHGREQGAGTGSVAPANSITRSRDVHVLLLCAVLLAGVAVSAAGPVPFVALVAPQITMRLRSPCRR
ncbi:iron chelate uptake ABC transporter family permease subunit [Lentzea roselyniae]|uniref:iron chelate uptake ABC transporter family permease subunit n=1 Tax=Lentzea roselyniae TaxID=531940 RepID=UPI003D158990